MGEMLTQGNSYSHVPARRTVWLKAMQPLFQVQVQCVSIVLATVESYLLACTRLGRSGRYSSKI